MQTFTTLDLAQNRIGNKGAEYLADALQNNIVRIVLYLFISYTHVSFNIGAHSVGSEME